MNRRGSWSWWLLAVVMVLVMAPGPSLAENWKGRWKFATLAPDGVGWAVQIKNVVLPAIDKATDGNLKVKVYWGGVMGDDEDYVKKIRIGQLQGAGWSGQGVTIAVPEMAVLELPFMFKDYGEVDYIKAKMTPTFDKVAKKNGFFPFAYIDEDFCRAYSASEPMTKIPDYARTKFLSWFGPVEGYTLKRLGANPIQVNLPEAPSSIRQGVGNTICCSAIWIVGTQLYSQIKYISPYSLRYAPAMIAVDQKVWDDLPDQYRNNYFSMREQVITDFCDQVRKDQIRCLKAIKDYGLIERPISPENLAAIKNRTRPLWDDLAGKLYPRALLDELLGHLDEYRQAQAKN